MSRTTKITLSVVAVAAGSLVAASGAAATVAGTAAAQPKPPSPPATGPEHVTVRKSDSSRLPCWTTITQPGGAGTTVNVFYNNCAAVSAHVTPNNHATTFEGTYTYVNLCRTVPAGFTGQWTFLPSMFPPGDTNRWGITNCI